MSVVEVPKSGTRGGSMPRLPGPLMQWINDAMFFMNRGRRFAGLYLLRLTTVGAHSGRPRRSTLGCLQDTDGAWVIIGSANGAAKNPAWVYNIAKHPDQVWIQMAGPQIRVQPEMLKGEQRAAMWQRVVAASPGYAAYETKTDREIPLIRLVPA